jgi:hypothetical protein
MLIEINTKSDKLTRRVWDEILKSDFVAQTLVPQVGA